MLSRSSKVLFPATFAGGIKYSHRVCHVANKSFSLILLASIQVLADIPAILAKLGQDVWHILDIRWGCMTISSVLLWYCFARLLIESQIGLICDLCGRDSLLLALENWYPSRFLRVLRLSWSEEFGIKRHYSLLLYDLDTIYH